MAKAKKRKKSAKRRGGQQAQRTKFKKAAKACQAEIRGDGVIAFSKEQWSRYGKCMKKSL